MYKMVIFLISVFLFCALIYMVGSIWFRGKRSTYLKLFFTMGMMYSFWALFNGFNLLLSEEIYTQIYPMLMILACILPHVMVRYVFFFTESPLAKSRFIKWASIIMPSIDILLLLTNPWHREYITGYDGVHPIGGRLINIHMLFSYIPVLISMVILLRYIIKNIRKTPSLALIGFAFFLPFVLNILYTFSIFDPGFDITPFAFLIMFSIFTIYSIRLRLFNIKESVYTSLFTSLSEAFLVIDSTGLVAEANPSFRNAFSMLTLETEKTGIDDVVSFLRSITTQTNPEDVYSSFRSYTDEIRNAEITVYVNGELRNYTVSKDFIIERGQYAGFIITFSDISNYRKMINEINEKNVKLTELKDLAESASNAKSIFLANMSHEIRTPMNAVIGMVEIAKTSDDPEKITQCLDKINASSRFLLSIINDILDMSKIESSSYILYEDRFILSNMIENVISINSPLIANKDQHLSTSFDENIPQVLISDEMRLSQVINNLLSNAVKFTSNGGHIELAVKLLERDEQSVRLQFSVKDDGIGISEDKQSVLFKAFEQADLSISRQFGGTGLGLTISQKIVELMGGSIRVESSIGNGSRFSFDVCIQIAPEDSVYNTAAINSYDTVAENESYDFTGYTILLAEDVEINREIILSLMEDTGVQIECAENGQIAVEMFFANPQKYDMIYMDIQMPIMDGYTASQEIRSLDNKYAKNIPIVAMTANAFAEDVEKAREYSMDDHIAKPIDIKELYQKTKKYIGMQRK